MPKSNVTDGVLCPACGRLFHMITASHYRLHGYQTAKDFCTAYGLKTLVCSSKKARQSLLMFQRNPMSGQKHSEGTLVKMTQNRAGKGIGTAGKYERTEEIRRKISQGVTRAMQAHPGASGESFLCEKAGGEVWTRSSWERRVLRVFDLHPCVMEVVVEPLSIPYFFEGQERLYVPDFLLTLEGGIRELWEVKPIEMMLGQSLSARKNRRKRWVLDKFVQQQGWNGRWVTLDDIVGMEMQVGLRPWVGPGSPWVDPNNLDLRPVLGGA
jgi:hypothetical protein